MMRVNAEAESQNVCPNCGSGAALGESRFANSGRSLLTRLYGARRYQDGDSDPTSVGGSISPSAVELRAHHSLP